MQWRFIPTDLPPWPAVYQQTVRWLKASSFEAIVHDLRLRELLRVVDGRNPEPSAAIFDGRTLQSTPESGARAGYDGHKRKKGSKVHLAVDTLGHLLALLVTPANEQERAQVEELAKQVQEVTNQHVEVAFVDQGYTGPGLHGRRASRGGQGAGDQAGSGEASRGQAGLRHPAEALGRRAILRLDGQVPSVGQGLREACRHAQGPSLCRLRHPALASLPILMEIHIRL